LSCSQKINFLFIALGLPILFFTGCQKEVIISIPNQEPRYVVNCLFQPFTVPYPENISLSLSQTIGFLDSLSFPIIDDADIQLFYEDSVVGDFGYSVKNNLYYLEGIHHLNPGVYRIEIAHEDEIIIANDFLPNKVNLDKITINPLAGYNYEDGRAFARVTFTFKEPEKQDNYYEIFISHTKDSSFYKLTTDYPSIITESYYPSVMNIEGDNPESLPFNDIGINGQDVSIPVEYLLPFAPINGIIEPHVIIVHFRTISRNYYLYKTSIIRQNYNNEADIIYGQGEPMNVYGNIPGNFGIFAGYQSVDVAFIINNNEIIEYEF